MITLIFLQAKGIMEYICYFVACVWVYKEHKKQPVCFVWTLKWLGVLLEKQKLNTEQINITRVFTILISLTFLARIDAGNYCLSFQCCTMAWKTSANSRPLGVLASLEQRLGLGRSPIPAPENKYAPFPGHPSHSVCPCASNNQVNYKFNMGSPMVLWR